MLLKGHHSEHLTLHNYFVEKKTNSPLNESKKKEDINVLLLCYSKMWILRRALISAFDLKAISVGRINNE